MASKTATRRRRQAAPAPKSRKTKRAPKPPPAAVPTQVAPLEDTAPLEQPVAGPVVADAAVTATAEADKVRADAETAAEQLLADARREADAATTTATAEAAQIRIDAETAAEQLLADARTRANEVTTTAASQAEQLRSEAAAKALADAESTRTEVLASAEDQAVQVRAGAEKIANGLRQDADRALAEARAAAEELRAAAHAAAQEVRAAADGDADRLLAATREKADGLVAAAQEQGDKLRKEAEQEAARCRAEAQSDADRARSSAEAEIDRARQQTEYDLAQLREVAADDASRTRAAAQRDAERMTAESEACLETARGEAATASADARRQKGEAAELQQQAQALMEQATEAMDRATSREQRKLERHKLRSQRRAIMREERAKRRSERRQERTERARGTRVVGMAHRFIRDNARRFLVSGPILAPMAVAWWSQMDYAREAFGWLPIFAIGFAAAWELTTAFTGWMYHQARKVGDGGLLYRFFTWVFAGGAAAMNYAHHCGPNGEPTQAAVAFATMSIVGMVLWELYASLLHRTEARDRGLAAKVRPRIGFIRWFRYPVQSWTAWSLTIENQDLDTLDKAWNAAGSHRRQVHEVRDAADLGAVRRTIATLIGIADRVPVRSLPVVPNSLPVVPAGGSRTAAEVPNLVPHWTVTRARTSPLVNLGLPPVQEPGEPRALESANPNQASNANQPDGEPLNGTGSRTKGTDGEPANANRGPRGKRAADRERQVQDVVNLIDEHGFQAVTLDVVCDKTGMAKTTAFHRLKDARNRWNANRELQQAN